MHLRHKTTDILMIIGLTISFLIVVYGIGIYNSAATIKTAADEARFDNEYNFTLKMPYDESSTEGDALDVSNKILSVLDVDVGNVSISYGGIAGQAVLPFEGFMYIEMNEEPKKKLEWGRYPTKEEIEKNVPVLIVNNAMLEYAEKDSGKYYLDVYGDRYEIIGVLDDLYQTFSLGELIMFYDCLGTNSKNIFYFDLYNSYSDQVFKYESSENIAEKYNEIKARAKENGLDLSFVTLKDAGVEPDWYTTLISNFKSLFSTIVFIFSIFNCCSISLLWIKHRMKEYSIRKALGYNTIQLFIHAIKELIPLLLISMIVTVTIQLVNTLVFKAAALQAHNILPLIITMFLSVALAMVIPFIIIAKVKPATGIKEL